MPDTTITAKVGEDSELYARFEEYRTDRDMTKSEAVRALVRAGLRAETTPDSRMWMYLSLALIGFEIGARLMAPLLSLSQGVAVVTTIAVLMLLAEAGSRYLPSLGNVTTADAGGEA